METCTYLSNLSGWYNLSGPANDVVISSRIRLTRNLSNHRFTSTLDDEGRKRVVTEVIRAFEELPERERFSMVNPDSLTDEDRELVCDRNILGEMFSVRRESPILRSDDGSILVVVNDEDHVRLSAIRSGLALSEAYEAIDRIDTTIEKNISYSVSNEFGYLTSRIADVGTGMKASIFVHLPGLAMTSLIKDTFKILNEKGLANRAYGGETSEHDSSIFEIYNYFPIGYTEQEIIETLTDIAHSMCALERKMRGVIHEKKKKSIEDKVFRALGILKYSRSISRTEALRLLSLVRLGIALDMIREFTLEQVTFLLLSAFMNNRAPEEEKEIDGLQENNSFDTKRAKIIREVLGR
jgi:protein arginine kinase